MRTLLRFAVAVVVAISGTPAFAGSPEDHERAAAVPDQESTITITEEEYATEEELSMEAPREGTEVRASFEERSTSSEQSDESAFEEGHVAAGGE